MLERTAASLEPCTTTFQRSLSITPRSQRKLHTGFWQHGAAAIDLSSLWTGPGQGIDHHDRHSSRNAEGQSHPSAPAERLMASALLFDFLYPRGTAAFLRRLSPSLLDRNPPSTCSHPTQANSARLFTSSMPSSNEHHAENSNLQQNAPETVHQKPNNPESDAVTESSGSLKPVVPTSEPSSSVDVDDTALAHSASKRAVGRDSNTVASYGQPPQLPTPTDGQGQPSIEFAAANVGSRPDLVRKLIAEQDPTKHQELWVLWDSLDKYHQTAKLRKSIINTLYGSGNLGIVEAERIWILFQQLQPEQWTESVVSNAIAAEIRRGYPDDAVKIFNRGLRERKLAGGLHHLIDLGLRGKGSTRYEQPDWSMIIKLWEACLRHCGKALPLSSVRQVASPDLASHVLAFQKILSGRHPKQNEKMQPMIKALAKTAIEAPCPPAQAQPLLNTISEMRYYEIYFRKAARQGFRDREPMTRIYQTWRQSARFEPSSDCLDLMFEVFYPDNIAGLEQLYEDWHVICGGLDLRAHQKYLKLYASRGDVKSVSSLWKRFIRKYSDEAKKSSDLQNHLLNAYRRKGDLKAVYHLFDEMRSLDAGSATVASWNIVLKAVCDLGTYDAAIEFFSEFCETTEPDAVSFSTIMDLAGRKGDYDYTMGLFEKGKDMGIEGMDTSTPNLAAIVKVLCRSGKPHEAERVCINRSHVAGLNEPANLWNILLVHYAFEMKIKQAYKVLGLMKQHGVAWNKGTNQALLLGLVLSRRTQSAYRFLRSAVQNQDPNFPVTAHHFRMVMVSALQTRESGLVQKIREWMPKAGLTDTMDTMDAVVNALLRLEVRPWLKLEGGEAEEAEVHRLGTVLVDFFRQVVFDEEMEESGFLDKKDLGLVSDTEFIWPPTYDGPTKRKVKERFIKGGIQIMAQFKDFMSAEQLLDLYVRSVPGLTESEKNLPLPILEAVMLANFYEGKHEKAKEIWELAFTKALAVGRPELYKPPKRGTPILPNHRYDLVNLNTCMLRILKAEGQPDPILKFVGRVQDAGYKFTSPQWNTIVFHLAKQDRWTTACEICENVLMPHWQGWDDVRVWGARRIKDIRLRHRDYVENHSRRNRHLRPTTQTIAKLQGKSQHLYAKAPWSAAAAEQIAQVEKKCPKLIHAWKSRAKYKSKDFRSLKTLLLSGGL